jgi:hypothetical protein
MGSELRLRAPRLAVILLASLALIPVIPCGNAQAQSPQDRATARILADEADKKVSEGDYKAALDLFTRANSMFPAPTLQLARARMLIRLGQLIEAQQAMQSVARSDAQPGEPAPWTAARLNAAREADELAARIPAVDISVQGAPLDQVIVLLDGQRLPKEAIGVPRAVNPGPHKIRIEAAGFLSIDKTVTLADGQRERMPFTLEKPAPKPPPPPVASSAPTSTSSATAAPPAPTHEQPPPPPPKTSPLVLGGFIGGGALVGLGAIFGIVSAAKVSDIKKDCLGSSCFPNRKSDGDSASTFANLSNISIALGAIGVGVGIYGLMSSPSSAPAAAARRGVDVHVGAGTVAVSGSF